MSCRPAQSPTPISACRLQYLSAIFLAFLPGNTPHPSTASAQVAQSLGRLGAFHLSAVAAHTITEKHKGYARPHSSLFISDLSRSTLSRSESRKADSVSLASVSLLTLRPAATAAASLGSSIRGVDSKPNALAAPVLHKHLQTHASAHLGLLIERT